MPSLNKNSGRYYLQFYNGSRKPKRKTVALQTTRKRPAEKKARELEDAYVEGRFDPWTDDPFAYDKANETLTLEEAFERFCEAKREAGRRPATLRSYRSIIRPLIKRVGGETYLETLSRAELSSFIRDTSISKSSRRSRFRHVRAFLNWCMKEDYLHEYPLEGFEAPEKPAKLPKRVTRDMLNAICQEIRKEYREKREAGTCKPGELIWREKMFKFAYFTGLRRSEIARLRWEHIDREAGFLYIRRQKNKRESRLPLNERALQILDEIEEGKPWDFVFKSPSFTKRERNQRAFGRNQSRKFKHYREQAGIERPVSFHGLRHGYASELAEAGKPAHVIKKACRHQDLSTTLRYIDLADNTLQAELNSVFS